MGFIEKENRTYAIIIDGSIRIPAKEGDEGAVKREFETKDGAKKIKIELVKKGIKGFIEDIVFKNTDFGTMINIVFKKEEGNINNIVLSISASSNYGHDLMKKLPNVDLTKEVSLSPYSFEDDNKKLRRGITIWQGEEGDKQKIESFFNDKEGKKAINGFPEPEGDTKLYNNNKWKMYFLTVEEFLIKYTEENVIPKLSMNFAETAAYTGGEEVNVNDVPFT